MILFWCFIIMILFWCFIIIILLLYSNLLFYFTCSGLLFRTTCFRLAKTILQLSIQILKITMYFGLNLSINYKTALKIETKIANSVIKEIKENSGVYVTSNINNPSELIFHATDVQMEKMNFMVQYLSSSHTALKDTLHYTLLSICFVHSRINHYQLSILSEPQKYRYLLLTLMWKWFRMTHCHFIKNGTLSGCFQDFMEITRQLLQTGQRTTPSLHLLSKNKYLSTTIQFRIANRMEKFINSYKDMSRYPIGTQSWYTFFIYAR